MRNPSKSKNPYSFKPMFPTFQRTDNHPKNKCVPCCSQVPLTFNGNEKKENESIEEEEVHTLGDRDIEDCYGNGADGGTRTTTNDDSPRACERRGGGR